MSVLSAQIEVYNRLSAVPPSAPSMSVASLQESIDVGLGLYDALMKAVARAAEQDPDEKVARSHHELAGRLAESFGSLLREVKEANTRGDRVGNAERLEEAWKELLPAAQFSFERLHAPRGATKSAGEVRDGLRDQIPGRS